jgi:hypothetical protein
MMNINIMKKQFLLLDTKLNESVLKLKNTKEIIRCGLGECQVDGCHCRAFEGNDYTCENCGHNKDRHW